MGEDAPDDCGQDEEPERPNVLRGYVRAEERHERDAVVLDLRVFDRPALFVAPLNLLNDLQVRGQERHKRLGLALGVWSRGGGVVGRRRLLRHGGIVPVNGGHRCALSRQVICWHVA